MATKRPCSTYPGEVEDFYCTLCRTPCSALSLLVGHHTNHPRVHLEEALESAATDFALELSEFSLCVQSHVTGTSHKTLQNKRDLQNVFDAINEVSDEIARLEERRALLVEKQSHLKILADEIDAEANRRASDLEQIAKAAIKSLEDLLQLYGMKKMDATRAENEKELKLLIDGFSTSVSHLRNGYAASIGRASVKRLVGRGIVDECVLVNRVLNSSTPQSSLGSESSDDKNAAEGDILESYRNDLDRQFQALADAIAVALTSNNKQLTKQLLRSVKHLCRDAKEMGIYDFDSTVARDHRVKVALAIASC